MDKTEFKKIKFKEESFEGERKKTKGGYEYVETEEGLIIRNSFSKARLREDEETYEEYKIRQHLADIAEKQNNRPRLYWDTYNWGTMNPTNIKRVQEAFIKQLKKEEGNETKVNTELHSSGESTVQSRDSENHSG